MEQFVSVLDKVRKWIDGETAELVLEEAARNAQVKPRSEAEEFIVKIARSVEEVMQRELVPLPQGTTIIPTEYIVFLSEADDKDWQGIKRRGLEQGLYHILAERAKEIAGKRKLETRSFVIELRVDGTLETGEVRVQHSWDEGSSNKTGVLARPKPGESAAPPAPSNIDPPNFTAQPSSFDLKAADFKTSEDIKIPNVAPLASSDVEIVTHVQPRQQKELYRLEIWRGGVRQNVTSIFSETIKIGRGSRSKPVDVMLPGDPEISRHHVTLAIKGPGQFAVTNHGRNPASINGNEMGIGEMNFISPGIPIAICSYLIRIQPQ